MIFTTNVWPDCKPVPTNVDLHTRMILSRTPSCKAVERDDLGHYLESHSRHYEYMLSAAACAWIVSLKYTFWNKSNVLEPSNVQASNRLAFGGPKHTKSMMCFAKSSVFWNKKRSPSMLLTWLFVSWRSLQEHTWDVEEEKQINLHRQKLPL